MKQLIEINNLSFSYPTGYQALQKVSFHLKPNEFLGLVGPNGSGKTTLFRIIIGELSAEDHRVRVLGEEVPKHQHRIGYVPQHHAFNKRCPLSVKDVILTGLLGKGRWMGGYNSSDHSRADKVLRDLNIAQLEKTSIHELSGGQTQKVMIARALVSDPAVLILDEPTAHLDSASAEILYRLLKKLKKNLGIILSSHDVDAVTEHCDRMIGLNRKLFEPDEHEKGDDFMLRVAKGTSS
jgi:zinc transport system ATP-binding protein